MAHNLRSRKDRQPPSRSGSSIAEPPAKRRRSHSQSSDDTDVGSRYSPSDDEDDSSREHRTIKVYILQAKLPEQTFEELVELLESLHEEEEGRTKKLELCREVEDADVIITAVTMRKRLERHVDWKFAKQKAIVTPAWLRDSITQKQCAPCGDYVALNELSNTTKENCPDTDSDEETSTAPTSDRPREDSPDNKEDLSMNINPHLQYTARYACMRNSPMKCPNQALVARLDILRQQREFDGLGIRALSYARAIATLKAYPHKITEENLRTAVPKLPFLGEKILSKVKEFIKTGEISESNSIASTTRFQSLSEFTTIYGIGPATARNLYSEGLRTLDDLDRYYELPPQADDIDGVDPGTRSKHKKGGAVPDISIQVGLALREDFSVKISREEVKEMHEVVERELGYIMEGCVSTVTGGYRRGKAESSDVDIVISHSDIKSGSDHVRGLCDKLVRGLYDKGIITHVMNMSSYQPRGAVRHSDKDLIETALAVFLLPSDGTRKEIHRRVDLIFAAPEIYWTAVMGWTGSKMFERDLRLWAKEQGMKFDSSGITRRHDSKMLYAKSEEDVFKILGLEWVDPTMRNADA